MELMGLALFDARLPDGAVKPALQQEPLAFPNP
jgi:hypothetical protein